MIKSVIASSKIMQSLVSEALKAAKSNAHVFLTGESGTGKEVIAQLIHENSLRKEAPFVCVNCAAIADSLLESEFFGHEKGSFTGAFNRRLGRFELADKGTLLLDEVTEMAPNLQSKLLRVLQEQEFERIGGNTPLKVDVRLISTSNREIKEAIASKKLREDLFYRLNVIPLHLPPLRERKEDIIPLANYFLNLYAKENNQPTFSLTPAAIDKLLQYNWPGNIRELSNLMERIVVMHERDTLIKEDDLYLEESSSLNSSVVLPIGKKLLEVERELILQTLKVQGNNQSKTAKVLGISTRTLRNKLASYNTVDAKIK